MKKLIVNIFSTTGFAIVILSVIVSIQNLDIHFSKNVIQIFAANTIINLGLLLTNKLHRGYRALDMLIDIVYTATVVIIFGRVFFWFSITPMWALILMAAGIYSIGYALDMVRVREEIKEINKLLKKRDNSN